MAYDIEHDHDFRDMAIAFISDTDEYAMRKVVYLKSAQESSAPHIIHYAPFPQVIISFSIPPTHHILLM